MIEWTIKVSPEVIGKLKSLQHRVNENLALAIDRGIERPVNIHRIATALIKMGLSETSRGKISFKRDKITFAVMVAQQQIANSKGAVVYKKIRKKGLQKDGNGEK